MTCPAGALPTCRATDEPKEFTTPVGSRGRPEVAELEVRVGRVDSAVGLEHAFCVEIAHQLVTAWKYSCSRGWRTRCGSRDEYPAWNATSPPSPAPTTGRGQWWPAPTATAAGRSTTCTAGSQAATLACTAPGGHVVHIATRAASDDRPAVLLTGADVDAAAHDPDWMLAVVREPWTRPAITEADAETTLGLAHPYLCTRWISAIVEVRTPAVGWSQGSGQPVDR